MKSFSLRDKGHAAIRRLTPREIPEKSFRLIPRFKSKDELPEEESLKFAAGCKPEEVAEPVRT